MVAPVQFKTPLNMSFPCDIYKYIQCIYIVDTYLMIKSDEISNLASLEQFIFNYGCLHQSDHTVYKRNVNEEIF